MLYTILIYGVEGVYDQMPPEEQEAVLDKHRALQKTLTAEGVLGPVAKLMETSAAVTIRSKGNSLVVTDGPFAETKEQLLGFYMVECETIEQAIEAAKALPQGLAAYEIRPVAWSDRSVEAPTRQTIFAGDD